MRRSRSGGAATVVDSTATVHNAHFIPPVAYLIIGVLAIVFGLYCITIQLQTTEANLQGLASMDVFQLNLSVLWQPIDLFTGEMSFTQRMSYTIAWIIEIATGIFIVGYADALDVTGSSGWVMQRFWFLMSWALFFFNFQSDFKYGSIPGANYAWLGHLEFAVGISAAVCFFPIIGLHLIRKGNALARGG